MPRHDTYRDQDTSMPQTPDGRLVIRPSPLANLGMALSGGLLVALAIAFPLLVPQQGWYDLVMALLFITVPAAMGGGIVLRQAWLRSQTVIALDDTGLRLRIPTWAGRCAAPLLTAELRWEDIESISHQQVVYGPVAMLSVAADEYTLRTPRGNYTLVKAFCPRVHQVVATIAQRVQVPIERLKSERRLGWWRPARR